MFCWLLLIPSRCFIFCVLRIEFALLLHLTDYIFRWCIFFFLFSFFVCRFSHLAWARWLLVQRPLCCWWSIVWSAWCPTRISVSLKEENRRHERKTFTNDFDVSNAQCPMHMDFAAFTSSVPCAWTISRFFFISIRASVFFCRDSTQTNEEGRHVVDRVTKH